MADGWNGIAMDSQFSDKPSSVVHPGNSRLPSVFGCGQIHSPWRKKAMMWSFFLFSHVHSFQSWDEFPSFGGIVMHPFGEKNKNGDTATSLAGLFHGVNPSLYMDDDWG